MKIKLYKTPTCGTCTMAVNRLEKEGADVEIIDLTEYPDILAELKKRLGAGPGQQIQVPLFEYDGGEMIFNITHLSELVERAKAVG